MQPPKLSQISFYPVKSTAGISSSSAWVELTGLAFDRQFMLVDHEGNMLTGRQYPQLASVQAGLTNDGISLSYASLPSLQLNTADFILTPINTHVWKDNCIGYHTTLAANEWFSCIIGEPVQLLVTNASNPRFSAKADINVSFADSHPLLLISAASLDALNARCPRQNKMSQFRTNLVVSGTDAFAEDGWGKIRIGEVEFRVDSPCTRCKFTTLDTASSQFDKRGEPLKTLARFRADKTGINFGMNLIPLTSGLIIQDMDIEILATRQALTYQDKDAKGKCLGHRFYKLLNKSATTVADTGRLE
ncbi:MAG: MOSC domain-containing protein [Ostreibacterium sp.]